MEKIKKSLKFHPTPGKKPSQKHPNPRENLTTNLGQFLLALPHLKDKFWVIPIEGNGKKFDPLIHFFLIF